MALIKGKQIATGANGIATANLVNNAVTPAKADLTATWDFSSGLLRAATPVGASDVAIKSYVDSVATGLLDFKNSVRVATTAALATNTGKGTGTLTASANGALVVDGVTVAVNNRILVKNEADGYDNGIYSVTAAGDGSNPYVITRSSDADDSSEVTSGMYTFVSEGTANASSAWVLTTADPITLNTTSLSFVQFSGLGQVTAGAGLTKTGNTLDVGAGNGIQVNADSVEVLYGNSGTITTVNAGDAASAGTNNSAARSDHEHAVSTAAATTLSATTTNTEGSSTSLARADHTHVISTGTQSVTIQSDAGTATTGTAATLLRTDAQLTAATATPSNVGTANAQGSSTSLARADHVHDSPEPTKANKNMTAEATTSDNDEATASSVTNAPALGTYVDVRVNGVQYLVGDGTKVSVDCYFSADAGSTAKAINAISSGDKLYWNGSVVGFQLATSDKIDFCYITFVNN